jgi:hypothetical protein
MKMLFEKFISALKQYTDDARSITKRATQEQAIKTIKLKAAYGLKNHLEVHCLNLDDNLICSKDYDALIKKIKEIQKEVAGSRDASKIEPGYFDALLVWMSDRLNAAKIQSTLPLIDESMKEALSDTRSLIKRKLDEFIVLLGGFSDFPDSRNAFERWSKHHPRVALYPLQDNWNEKELPSEEEVKSIAEQVETLKQVTLFQLRDQAEDQMKVTLYYMTVTELAKISPVLGALNQSLVDMLDLKPLVLKKIDAVEESVTSVSSENPLKDDQELKENNEQQEMRNTGLSIQLKSDPVGIEKPEPAVQRQAITGSLPTMMFSGFSPPKIKVEAKKTFAEMAKVKVVDDMQPEKTNKNKQKNN